jgi:hypothetical protein
MIQINAQMVAMFLGVNDVEAVELIGTFLLKLQNAPDKTRFLKESLRRALIEPDKKRLR